MRGIAACAVMSLLAVFGGGDAGVPLRAAHEAAQSAEGDIRNVLQTQHFAYWNRDVAAFGQIAGDDFYRIGQNGRLWTKDEHLASMQADPNLPATPSVHDEVRVMVHGESAVVTLLDHRPGTPVPATRSTYVFALREGRWQMVALHQTVVQLR